MPLFSYEKNVALEAIDHQRDNKVYKEKLIEQIDIIKSKLKDKVYDSNKDVISSGIETNKISDIILERTGIKLKFVANTGFAGDLSFNVGIDPYYDNALSPLNTIIKKSDAIDLFNSLEENGFIPTEGYSYKEHKEIRSSANNIDTKRGRVTGPINKHSIVTIADFKGLLTMVDMTAAELAGIIMHEVGHAFTYLLFNDKLATMNESLQNIGAIRNTYFDNDKMFFMAKKEFKDIDRSISDKDVNDLLSDNYITRTSAFFSFITKNLDIKDLSLYLVPGAANYNSETIADSYAARMGFSVELVQALDKIHALGTDEIQRIGSFYSIFGIVKLGAIMTLVGAFFGLAAAGLFLLRAMFYYHISAILGHTLLDAVLDIFPIIYKDPNERFRKVYNNEVDKIKTLDLTPLEREEIISNLKVIKSIIGNRKDTSVELSYKLYTTIFRSRGNESSYNIQQDMLEKLANNELFVKALELELLGDRK